MGSLKIRSFTTDPTGARQSMSMFSFPVSSSRRIQRTCLYVDSQFMSGIPSTHSTGAKYAVSTFMNCTVGSGSPDTATVRRRVLSGARSKYCR